MKTDVSLSLARGCEPRACGPSASRVRQVRWHTHHESANKKRTPGLALRQHECQGRVSRPPRRNVARTGRGGTWWPYSGRCVPHCRRRVTRRRPRGATNGTLRLAVGAPGTPGRRGVAHVAPETSVPPALLAVPAPEAAPCSVYSGRTVHLPELRGMRADGVGRFRSRVRPQRCRALSGPSTVGPQHRQGVRRRRLPCRSGTPPGHRSRARAMTASAQVWGTATPDDAEPAGRGLADATDPQQGRHLRKRDLGGPRRRRRPVRTSRRDRRSVGCNVARPGRGTTRCPDLDESVPHCSHGELRFGAGVRLARRSAPPIACPPSMSTPTARTPSTDPRR